MRPSTVSRGVSSGRLPANRLPTGELQIDAAVLDEFLSRRTAAASSTIPDRIKNLCIELPPDSLIREPRHGTAGA